MPRTPRTVGVVSERAMALAESVLCTLFVRRLSVLMLVLTGLLAATVRRALPLSQTKG
jgi:hypothetical protein